jgi:hypothetical protein
VTCCIVTSTPAHATAVMTHRGTAGAHALQQGLTWTAAAPALLHPAATAWAHPLSGPRAGAWAQHEHQQPQPCGTPKHKSLQCIRPTSQTMLDGRNMQWFQYKKPTTLHTANMLCRTRATHRAYDTTRVPRNFNTLCPSLTSSSQSLTYSPLSLTGAAWPVVYGQGQGAPLVASIAGAQDGSRVTCCCHPQPVATLERHRGGCPTAGQVDARLQQQTTCARQAGAEETCLRHWNSAAWLKFGLCCCSCCIANQQCFCSCCMCSPWPGCAQCRQRPL